MMIKKGDRSIDPIQKYISVGYIEETQSWGSRDTSLWYQATKNRTSNCTIKYLRQNCSTTSRISPPLPLTALGPQGSFQMLTCPSIRYQACQALGKAPADQPYIPPKTAAKTYSRKTSIIRLNCFLLGIFQHLIGETCEAESASSSGSLAPWSVQESAPGEGRRE